MIGSTQLSLSIATLTLAAIGASATYYAPTVRLIESTQFSTLCVRLKVPFYRFIRLSSKMAIGNVCLVGSGKSTEHQPRDKKYFRIVHILRI
jgi:hypothetical protein